MDRPRFDYGEEVRVVRNLRNDGTFPGIATGVLLVRRGSTGVVRDIGTFLQDQVIYTVHFTEADILVGCRDRELIGIDAAWVQSRFEFGEKVIAAI
ncbi:MAG TPA: nitrogen fixation protein NifZ, partial [Hyphomicrobiales bacterium]|nr:nitrogen fixation protein NifZ [Hyphomicrobiales bacterium]